MKIDKIDKLAIFDPKPNSTMQDAKSVLGLVNFPVTKHASMDNPTLTYGVRQVFKKSEYNLLEIGTIEDVESYVRQAFQKKTALMFKEGEGFTGKNKQTLDYIKLRIKQMEFVSGIPWRTLLRDTGYALISRSNFFWVKVRNQKASGGRPIGNVAPVAAYFGFGAEYVRLKKDLDDQLILYRQEFPDGRIIQFEPRDIIHFRAYKKPGFDFGTPQIIPVKDDIRALRRIEENIELLIYQTLFPIFHYKVGTEARPAGDIRLSDGTVISEVDYIKNQIAQMPAEGGIVTPERHEINFVGIEGKGLKAREYLDYFKTRVLSGLGVSSVDMGEGDCYSADTETLTSSGWKFHNEINHLEEKIATYNPETQLIEFHVPNYKYEGLYEGDMITFNGKHVDIKVTPHHEMWVKSRFGNSSWEKVNAVDLYNGKYSSEFYMLETAEFSNDSVIDRFHLQNIGVAEAIDCELTDFASLLGWFISEGCLDKFNAKRGSYRVILTQNRGEKLDSICDLLDRMNLNYSLTKSKRDNSVSVKIYGKLLYKYLEQYVGHCAENKNLPNFVYEWSKPARQALFNSLISGDGTIDQREGRTSQTYYTTSKQLTDDVQILAMSLGYCAKTVLTLQNKNSFGPEGSVIYRVLISKKSEESYRLINHSMISKERYSDMIYCYNVPNHLFVTRRNGKVTIQGNTANRATATAMSSTMIDSVKDYQDILEELINEQVIKELLLESTFDFDVLDEENIVRFKFKEIDIEEQMKKNTNAQVMYNGNIIDVNEARFEAGREPLTPDQEALMMFNRVTVPQTQMQADAQLQVAQTRASAKTGDGTVKFAKNANAPTNQHGTKTGPQASRLDMLEVRDYHVTSMTRMLRSDLSQHIEKQEIDKKWIHTLIMMAADNAIKKYNGITEEAFIKGIRAAEAYDHQEKLLNTKYLDVKDYTNSYIKKYVKDLDGRLLNTLDRMIKKNDSKKEMLTEINNIIDSIKYRSEFIDATERMRAYNYGKAVGLKAMGFKKAELKLNQDCDICKEYGKELDLTDLTIDSVPPFHPNSKGLIGAGIV